MVAAVSGVVRVFDLGDGHNALGLEVLDALDDFLDGVEQATGPRAIVLRARGRVWSNGLDLDWMLKHPSEMVPYLGRVHSLLARMIEIGVPTVAAVTGHAFGAGAMLAVCHDVAVMRADRGYWCLPEVDLGMWLTRGEHAILDAKLTPSTRNEALTTGRRYTGHDALAAGVVHEVADDDAVVERAIEIAAERAPKANTALAEIKRGLYGAAADQLRRDLVELAQSDDLDRMTAEVAAALGSPG